MSPISDGTFDLEARPHFPRATIWFEAGDWRYFIEERHGPPIQDHARQGFRGHRAILLGDAVTCPVQLDEPTWHSIGDVDPDLANRTREHLWRELEGENVSGAGAHFPELKFGRVLEGSGRRWWT